MKPQIRKIGTIDCDLVETNPVVFGGTLYRFEYVRPGYSDNHTGDSYSRFVNHDSGNVTPAFAAGFHLGTAYADGDRMLVTAVNHWDGERVHLFTSTDLENWEEWTILDLPGYGLFNTSMCQAGDRYVLMFEVGKPPDVAGVRFTARFATSTDLRDWTLTPSECTYSKDRYTAPHCVRYWDGWFYNFYLEVHNGYEQRVVRSQDLIHWQASPHNPVLRACDADRCVANPRLSPAFKERIATAENTNNSDIDFCEYNGQIVINYSWGNQHGVEHLAEAVCPGTLPEFLQGWFE